jgi:ABC-type transport system substrate-binding protein
LLSGQVDWVENPAPHALPQLKSRGFIIQANEQAHVWPWQFSHIEGSPWNDIKVRQAANLSIDREAMKDGLLGGLTVPRPAHSSAAIPGAASRNWRPNTIPTRPAS